MPPDPLLAAFCARTTNLTASNSIDTALRVHRRRKQSRYGRYGFYATGLCNGYILLSCCCTTGKCYNLCREVLQINRIICTTLDKLTFFASLYLTNNFAAAANSIFAEVTSNMMQPK